MIPSAGEGYLPGTIDSAETFAESDVTLTHDKTVLDSEEVQISGPATSSEKTGTVSWSWSGSTSNDAGILFQPDVDCGGVKFKTGPNTSATITLYRQSDGTNLGSASVGTSSVGAIGASLSAGTEYRLSHGSTTHDYGGSPDQSATDITVTDGWYNGGRDSNNLRSITDIVGTAEPNSGTAYVEWAYPSKVYDWGAAFFETVLDSATVDVYVEEDQSGSWTEIAGPISNGDTIPADPSNNVRFRIEFSRPSNAENPRLLQIHRQEVLL